MNSILVKIIMPSEVIFKANATMVNIPGGDGVFGVLPNHVKLTSTVAIGSISVFSEDKEKKFFIYGGMAQITPLEINIVSEFVVSLDDHKKSDVLNKIASLKSDLDSCEENSLEASMLNATITKYNSLLKFCE